MSAFDLHGTPAGPKQEQDYPHLWPLPDRVDHSEYLQKVVANGFAIGMIQADEEAMAAAEFIRDVVRPVNIMELGTCCGGWLYVMSKMRRVTSNIEHRASSIERRPGMIISVDRPWFEREPKPKWGPEMLKRELPGMVMVEGDIHEEQSRLGAAAIIEALQTASVSPRGVRWRNRVFKKGEVVTDDLAVIDLLFIDADHSYEGTAKHWEMYRPFVRPGGWVGFHDTANGWACGKFFQERREINRIARSPLGRWEVVATVGTKFGIGFVQV